MLVEKKVLHLISSIGFFGAENIALELCKASGPSGIKSILGIFDNSHNSNLEIIEKAKEKGILTEIFSCHGKFDFRLIIKLRNFIKSKGIDIVHSHGYKSNFYGFFSAINTQTKNVATCHNWLGETRKMKFYEMLDKLMLTKFDAVVAVSDAIQKELFLCGVTKDKITLIHNGVDVDKFSVNPFLCVSLKKKLGLGEHNNVIGIVGRLSEEKGHKFLLEAFKNIVSFVPDARLVIVGDGPLRKDLGQSCNRLGLDGKVIFTGKRDDIAHLLALFDVFVLASLMEGMPVALLEAMAARKPVVATNVGEIPNVIKDGFSGFIVEPKDVKTLEQCIIAILKNKNNARIMAERSHETIKQYFSLRHMVDAYVSIYEKICN